MELKKLSHIEKNEEKIVSKARGGSWPLFLLFILGVANLFIKIDFIKISLLIVLIYWIFTVVYFLYLVIKVIIVRHTNFLQNLDIRYLIHSFLFILFNLAMIYFFVLNNILIFLLSIVIIFFYFLTIGSNFE